MLWTRIIYAGRYSKGSAHGAVLIVEILKSIWQLGISGPILALLLHCPSSFEDRNKPNNSEARGF